MIQLITFVNHRAQKLNKYSLTRNIYCKNKTLLKGQNEQINNQNIDNSECFGVKFVKIYPKMTSQLFIFFKYCFG
jgi:hypothetical protein